MTQKEKQNFWLIAMYQEVHGSHSAEAWFGEFWALLNGVKYIFPKEEMIFVPFTTSTQDSSGHWTSRDNWYNGSKTDKNDWGEEKIFT